MKGRSYLNLPIDHPRRQRINRKHGIYYEDGNLYRKHRIDLSANIKAAKAVKEMQEDLPSIRRKANGYIRGVVHPAIKVVVEDWLRAKGITKEKVGYAEWYKEKVKLLEQEFPHLDTRPKKATQILVPIDMK